MQFNSLQFLLFFPVVTFLFFSLPQKYRWALLLAASCVFYMAFVPQYILILLLTIVVDYYAALWMQGSSGRKRKIYLVASIVLTCLILAIFKYFNFLNANIDAIASFFHLNYPIGFLNIVLPIGLSFHTFQSLSYVIEVYRGNQKPESHFGIYALYVMFYPQLVAGPIERPQNLLHQFRQECSFEYSRVIEGLTRMLLGFFKKVVIADNLAIYVNQAYGHPHHSSGVALFVATIFFAFQIYCDFSGYSDIAIGSAKVMGFTLMENFKSPYLSTSISEFWKRWHISLSTWFRDYVYIPLGGNRVSTGRRSLNFMVTFLLSGLWHGANWTYVIWGALHGLFMVIWNVMQGFGRSGGSWSWFRYQGFVTFWKRLAVFAIVACAWIFFRASSLSDALYIMRSSFFGTVRMLTAFVQSLASGDLMAFVYHAKVMLLQPPDLPAMSARAFVFLCCLVPVVIGLDVVDQRTGLVPAIRARHVAVRWMIYLALALSIMNFGVTEEVPFIYFQF